MPSETTQDADFDPEEIPDEFWDIIHQADGNRDTLRDIMMQASQEEILPFVQNFTEAATELKYDPFLQHVAPGTSEDGMDDIADWVVSQGKEAYTQVWRHPETIPKHIDVGEPTNLHFVAESVYYKRFGEMPDPD
jgi:hypothetical protein